jgi:hypothetical protein
MAKNISGIFSVVLLVGDALLNTFTQNPFVLWLYQHGGEAGMNILTLIIVVTALWLLCGMNRIKAENELQKIIGAAKDAKFTYLAVVVIFGIIVVKYCNAEIQIAKYQGKFNTSSPDFYSPKWDV